jgi:hypothetical protein
MSKIPLLFQCSPGAEVPVRDSDQPRSPVRGGSAIAGIAVELAVQREVAEQVLVNVTGTPVWKAFW